MKKYTVQQVQMNSTRSGGISGVVADSTDHAALQVARRNHALRPNDYLTWRFAVYYPNGDGTSGMQRYAYDPATDSVHVA